MTRILLIEDNEPNRDMLSRRLRRAGMDVLLACDARHGIEIAIGEQPDLILMDLRLPDMSGWDAARRLKDDPQTARIPLIALTAHAMEGDRQKAIEVGCDDYDTKPIDLPRLLEKIRLQLEQSAQRQSRPHDDPGGTETLPFS
jgi:two-component system cell cycle response regulator DivK